MKSVNNETHTALSHGISIKNFTSTNRIRNPIIGVKLVKKFSPPSSSAFLISAKAFPIALSTSFIAFKTIGKSNTIIKANIIIKNVLSEALVLDSKRRTTVYIINATIIVASINHIIKKIGSTSS